jgi:hypothetical protein
MKTKFGNDILHNTLICEFVGRRPIGRKWPHRRQDVLQHRMVALAVIGFQERPDSGDRSVATHLIQQLACSTKGRKLVSTTADDKINSICSSPFLLTPRG